MQLIFHVTGRDDWEAAKLAGEYRLSTRGYALEDVGFIHCSSSSQVEAVANRVYPGAERLVVLAIDLDRLGPQVRYELAGGDELFPHIYGPLKTDGVVAAHPLEPGVDGRFRFPLPPSTRLETDRLLLRDLEIEDLDSLHAILGDQATMHFNPAPWSRRRVARWIARNRASYDRFGFGLWAMISKQNGEFVGECGLSWQPVGYSMDPEREIVWHVRGDLGNSGLATEAALAVVADAREMQQPRRAIVLTSPDNLPSQAVARALGMAFEREDVLDRKLRLVFAMDL